MKQAILLSGGIDSTALAYLYRPKIAYTIDYGQLPAKGEVRAAKRIAKELEIIHYVISVDCSAFGSGDLAGLEALPIAPIPEWWPYRNQLLVTLASMACVSASVSELLLGSVKTDGIHADGTIDFYNKLDDLVSYQEGNLRIRVPAINMTSTELVKKSGIPFSLLGWAISCHKAEFACGHCRGCFKHMMVLKELGHERF